MTGSNIIIDDASYAAKVTIAFNTQPNPGDSVTIDGVTYTFWDAARFNPTGTDQILIGGANANVMNGRNNPGSVLDTAKALAAAINCLSSSSISSQSVPQGGSDYSSGTTAHPNVTADQAMAWWSDGAGDVSSDDDGVFLPVVVVTAKTTGTGGNSYTASFSSPTASGAITVGNSGAFAGGTSGLTADGEQTIVSWYGGHCDIDVSASTWGGASVQLQACTRLPAPGQSPASTDWIPIGSAYTANGRFSDFLNPCLLSATVTGGTNPKIRIAIIPSQRF